MTRSIKAGAFLVAPLVLASTMFGGVASAATDNIIELDIATVCTDVDSRQAIYAFHNKNDFEVLVDWENLTTGSIGTFVVPANSFDGYNEGTVGYATDYEPTDPNNTTVFDIEGSTSPRSQNARVGVACTPEQLPAADEDEGDNETPVVTTPTDEGGRGAGDGATTAPAATPAATTSRPTLADTGAEQIVPLAVAALFATAILGTTLAVRKNVL